MTREEGTAKLATLRESVEEQVKTYNDAVQNGRFEESTKADKAMTDNINEYTATVRDMCFEECKATDDTMLAAVKFSPVPPAFSEIKKTGVPSWLKALAISARFSLGVAPVSR